MNAKHKHTTVLKQQKEPTKKAFVAPKLKRYEQPLQIFAGSDDGCGNPLGCP